MFEFLSKLLDLVGEEQTLNLVAIGAASLWAWIQRTANVDRKNNAKLDQALNFLEAGVQKTYQIYVKERKKGAADGKLTEAEKKEAREMALSYAKGYATTQGLSLVKTLGADMIPHLMEKAVGGLKREASGSSVMLKAGSVKPAEGGNVNAEGTPGQ